MYAIANCFPYTFNDNEVDSLALTSASLKTCTPEPVTEQLYPSGQLIVAEEHLDEPEGAMSQSSAAEQVHVLSAPDSNLMDIITNIMITVHVLCLRIIGIMFVVRCVYWYFSRFFALFQR